MSISESFRRSLFALATTAWLAVPGVAMAQATVESQVVGTPTVPAGQCLALVVDNVTAAGTSLATATALTGSQDYVTSATSGQGVALPALAVGCSATVYNRTPVSLAVYPNTTGIGFRLASNIYYAGVAANVPPYSSLSFVGRNSGEVLVERLNPLADSTQTGESSAHQVIQKELWFYGTGTLSLTSTGTTGSALNELLPLPNQGTTGSILVYGHAVCNSSSAFGAYYFSAVWRSTTAGTLTVPATIYTQQQDGQVMAPAWTVSAQVDTTNGQEPVVQITGAPTNSDCTANVSEVVNQ